MRCKVVISGSTISGICTCVSTMTTPVSLNSRCSGCDDRPSAMMVSLTMPWRPRMTIQAKVRTTTLVTIGSTTRKISNACSRADHPRA